MKAKKVIQNNAKTFTGLKYLLSWIYFLRNYFKKNSSSIFHTCRDIHALSVTYILKSKYNLHGKQLCQLLT